MSDNTGSAVLILGAGLLYFAYHLDPIIVLLAILLGVGTWSYPTGSKESKRLIETQTRYYDVKAEYYRRKQP